MKMDILKIGVLSLMLFSTQAFGSRAVEIEEFYQFKVKEVLETRFPQTPFSVFVTVDTGKPESSRRDVRAETKSTPLPYWNNGEDETLDIWERMDIPLGTLIKQVRSVSVSVRVDATLSDSELDELKENLIKHLKLDAGVDRIEITRMNWSEQERFRNLKWVGGGLAIALLLLIGTTWFVSRLAINKLVKGLSKPIAEIGASTQNFANKALNMASDMGSQNRVKERDRTGEESPSLDIPTNINLVEIREAAIELLDRNRHFFESPDADFMDFLERKGSQDPLTVGSILAELTQESLKSIFRFGKGNWWYKAIAQPAPLTALSLNLLGEIDRLRVRRHFSKAQSLESQMFRELALILHRVDGETILDLMRGAPIDKVGPVLSLLPRDQGLSFAKLIFPGQWAVFLAPEMPKEWKLDPDFLKDLEARALEANPLRDNEEISSFFEDLDLMGFLDTASPRDERDFYQVLPRDSRIVRERFPFYSVLEADEKQLKVISGLFSPFEWAIALGTCDSSDRRQVLEKFPERLRFQVIENFKMKNFSKWDEVEVRQIRRAITRAYLSENERLQSEMDEIVNGHSEDLQEGLNEAA
ncbi:hypothetical protein GW916_01785 [bacterium]|nr:hypothetical protein [bacterium]